MLSEAEDVTATAVVDKKSKKSRKEKGTSEDKEKNKKRKHAEDEDPVVTEQPKSKKTKKEKKAKPAEGTVQPIEQAVESNELLQTQKKQNSEEEIPKEDGAERKKKKRRRDAEQEGAVDAEPKKDKKKKRKHRETTVTTEVSLEPSSSSASSSSQPSPEAIEAFLSKHSITIHASKNGGDVIPILAFDQLDISPELKPAFKGFKEPTPIQACSWPPALQGKDVVGIAETGSGKTLAFGIPALSRLISNSSSQKAKHIGIQVLVMAPTRELAIQTHDTLLALGEPFGITSVAIFGGVDKGGQIKSLKDNKAKIVVGTPGRIMDLVNDGVCDLSRVSYLVLDEADRMLDKGFENDIRTIIGYAKQGEDRQTLMFSATWPDSVRKLASSFQRDPVRVTVGSDDLTANSRVEQAVEVFDEPRTKDSRLLGHLRNLMPKTSKLPSLDDARVLVFVLYKKEATRVEILLQRQNYAVAGLHGDMSQAARMEALESFKTGKTRVLVATDVAARGLDIPNVAVVLNYSFPLTIEDYIHRIGRTGRGGKSGKSITFFTGENHERALAGELARVLRESGFDIEPLKIFPMTIKKKSHSVYGAFYRDDVPTPTGPTKIKF